MNGHIEWEQQAIDISVTFAAKVSPGTLPGRDTNSPRRNALHRLTHPSIKASRLFRSLVICAVSVENCVIYDRLFITILRLFLKSSVHGMYGLFIS